MPAYVQLLLQLATASGKRRRSEWVGLEPGQKRPAHPWERSNRRPHHPWRLQPAVRSERSLALTKELLAAAEGRCKLRKLQRRRMQRRTQASREEATLSCHRTRRRMQPPAPDRAERELSCRVHLRVVHSHGQQPAATTHHKGGVAALWGCWIRRDQHPTPSSGCNGRLLTNRSLELPPPCSRLQETQRLLSEPVPGISAAPSEDNLVSRHLHAKRRRRKARSSIAVKFCCSACQPQSRRRI